MPGERADVHKVMAHLDWEPMADETAKEVELLASNGRWREAVGRARAAVRDGAEQQELFLALARGALRNGRADRCLKTLDRLEAEGIVHRDVVDMRVRALMHDNRQHEARVALERYLLQRVQDAEAWHARRKLLPSGPGIRTEDPAVTLRWAARLAKAGELARSARLLRRMLHRHPNEPTLKKALKQVEARLGSSP